MNPSWFLITVLLVSLNNIIGASKFHYQRGVRNECPAQEEISRCHCTPGDEGLTVICKHFETDTELKNHLNRLQGHTLRKLEINHYKAPSIPTDLWNGLEVEDLSLVQVEVNDASFRRGKRHFQGLEKSLQTLEIRNSFRNGHRPLLNLQLDHLENLKHLIFEDNSIPEVGNDWFASGPEKLTTLIFERNAIEELGDRAFSSLNNLKLLAVAGNHIHSISRAMLPQSADLLTTLDLAYNKIRSLPKDIFSGMSSLEDVNLDYNLIHMIREDTWSSLSSRLKSLRLEGNTLQCDESLQWICDTNLKNAHGKCSSPVEKNGHSVQQFCKR